jgi:hypothetical protein
MIDNSNKIILDLCGGTGAWSRPYKDAGYDVRVVTLPEYDVTNVIFSDDYMVFNKQNYDVNDMGVRYADVYGILAAPPCTKFSKAAWMIKKADRDFAEGMKCVRACLNIIWKVQENGAPLKFWALENPMGYLYNFLGFPAFYFQPWQFGDTSFLATKRTALWGYFKKPVKTVLKRTIPYVCPHTSKRDQVDEARENKAWNNRSTAKERAITPPGFAQAFFRANR